MIEALSIVWYTTRHKEILIQSCKKQFTKLEFLDKIEIIILSYFIEGRKCNYHMDPSDKQVSKVYRKLITSDDFKAYIIYEKLNDQMRIKIKTKLTQNGSVRANTLLHKLQGF